MQVSPNVTLAVSIGAGLLGFAAHLAPDAFPSFISAGVATDIIKESALGFGAISVISGILGAAYSSSQPGILAPKDPPVVSAAAALATAAPEDKHAAALALHVAAMDAAPAAYINGQISPHT